MGGSCCYCCRIVFVVAVIALGFMFVSLEASEGDADPIYRTCVEECENTGTLGDVSIQHCSTSADGISNRSWYMQEPLYISWKQWNCRSDCRYHCMERREQERRELGLQPVKYHGKWPFKRISAFQEPASAALSAMNLFLQFHGWLTFFLLLHYKLPLRPQSRRTYYEYTGLWHIYSFLSMNAWFWSVIFHSRDFELSEKLDCSSTVALIGYSLILTILRTFSVRNEASRVMVSAPLLAFLTTHILYLNFYELDYGLNMKVTVAMGVAQILLWAAWAVVTHHPSRFKLLTVLIGGSLGLLLDYYDFPPYKGYFDAHALWYAITIPLTFLWWSFIKEDAEFRTSAITKKVR